jgi:hypothetical protein
LELQFRSEYHAIPIKVIVEWLDADSVSGQEQLLTATIPNRKSEHAVQFGDTIIAVFFVSMNDCFSVRMGSELMPFLLDLA